MYGDVTSQMLPSVWSYHCLWFLLHVVSFDYCVTKQLKMQVTVLQFSFMKVFNSHTHSLSSRFSASPFVPYSETVSDGSISERFTLLEKWIFS